MGIAKRLKFFWYHYFVLATPVISIHASIPELLLRKPGSDLPFTTSWSRRARYCKTTGFCTKRHDHQDIRKGSVTQKYL